MSGAGAPVAAVSGRTLTVASIPEYLAARPDLAAQIEVAGLQVAEVGDGNLNQVFICRGRDGRNLVLKQALPYVRLVGPSWPMTEERAAREAHAIRTHAALSDRVCAVTFYDPDWFVLALEDLTDHTVLRTHLNEGNDIGSGDDGVAAALGRHVADVSYGTSFLAMEPEPFRLAAAAAVNSELCDLTEDVIFTEPFLGADRNSVGDPRIQELVDGLQADPAWVGAAMRAKRRFLTVQEALLHGDLHSGSVFVRRDPTTDAGGDQRWSVKTFDPEFSFYGPIGFDLGLLQANLLIAAVRAQVLGDTARAAALLTDVGTAWSAFADRFRALFADRPRPSKFSDDFVDGWLADIHADTQAFAGCEMSRRVIGLAKVTDLESLPIQQYVAAATAVLRLTRSLLVDGGLPDDALSLGE